ncbi:MAG: hypothetical protein JOY83_08570 [Alphaproteobacteria bacterium]|nr:hypothetical protein [Alphaproteobacteria bacterium]
MITGRIVGDDAVIAWLRGVTDAAASGLARAISELCLDLQRKLLRLNADLQIDQSGDRIAGIIFGEDNHRAARERRAAVPGDLRAHLRRAKEASRSGITDNAIKFPSYRRRIEPPQPSFLSSALEDMDPEIRDRVGDALREAVER